MSQGSGRRAQVAGYRLRVAGYGMSRRARQCNQRCWAGFLSAARSCLQGWEGVKLREEQEAGSWKPVAGSQKLEAGS